MARLLTGSDVEGRRQRRQNAGSEPPAVPAMLLLITVCGGASAATPPGTGGRSSTVGLGNRFLTISTSGSGSGCCVHFLRPSALAATVAIGTGS